MSPYHSKTQERFFFSQAKKKDSGISMKMAKEWAKETPNIKALPEKVKSKKRGKK